MDSTARHHDAADPGGPLTPDPGGLPPGLDPELGTVTCDGSGTLPEPYRGRLVCVHTAAPDGAVGAHVATGQFVDPAAVVLLASEPPALPLCVLDPAGRREVVAVHGPTEGASGELARLYGLDVAPGPDDPPGGPRRGNKPWICVILPNLDCCR